MTLQEATPVFEADRLQKDLMKAGIVPHWWAVNQRLYTTRTQDPALKKRALAEKNGFK